MTEKAERLGNERAFADLYMKGLNKREYFAGLVMQGLLSNGTILNIKALANEAVECADALLEELSKNE